MARLDNRSASAALAALAVFGVVTALFIAGWRYSERQEAEALRLKTQLAAGQIANRIETYFDTHIELLRYVRDEWTSGPMTPERFTESASEVQRRFSGIISINRIDADGVIRQVVPEAGNAAALGQDLTRHPVAGPLLRKATRIDAPRVTPVIELFQGGLGFAAILPTLRGGRPDGFISAVFRSGSGVSEWIDDRDRELFGIRVLEGTQLVYGNAPVADSPDQAEAAAIITVGDRKWHLYVTPTERLFFRSVIVADETVLVLGVVIALLLAIVLWRLLVSRVALRDSREHYRRIVEDMPALVCRFRPDTTLTFVNQAYADYFRRSPHDLVGRSFLDLVPPEQHALIRSKIDAVDAPGELIDQEHEVLGPAGERRWQRWRDRALHDDKGNTVEFQSIGLDITELRELERQLRHSHKMEAVGTLAGGIAHDFNNILTAIAGHAERASMRGIDDELLGRSLAGIEEACRKATGLTRSILTFSRGDGVVRETVDLVALIAGTVEMLRPILPRAIEVVTALPRDRAVWVAADPTQIQQVLMNFAVNARDAMPQGGRLLIAVLETAKGACLTVEDTGGGMSEEICRRALEPFFTTKTRERGTGLGLSVVHGIVREHEGELTIDSEPGRGTRITVRLPLVSRSTEAIADYRPPRDVAADSRGTILVVEDSEPVRELISDTLRASGYEVVEAGDGVAALEVFNANDGIRLVILDIDLPKLNGTACLARLRRDGHDVPAILISGDPDPAIDPNHPPDGSVFMQKPFRMAELKSVVASRLAAVLVAD